VVGKTKIKVRCRLEKWDVCVVYFGKLGSGKDKGKAEKNKIITNFERPNHERIKGQGWLPEKGNLGSA